MKNLTPALTAHLAAGGPFIKADLYTITLVSGEVLRWADFDRDITHPGNAYVYASTGPALTRGRTRVVLGLQVDTLDLSIYPRDTDLLAGETLLAAAAAGALDRARVVLEHAFLNTDGSAVGVVNLFSGRCADIQLSRTEIKIAVNSDLEALAIQLPRNLYQAGCVHTLFDAGCGLDKGSWGVSSAVAAGVTASSLPCGLSQVAGWFTRGTVRFISGDLLGVSRTVKSYSPGIVQLFSPLPAVPAVGDLFIATPGCNKLQATCSGKFNNLSHFRGCPYIPEPETAI